MDLVSTIHIADKEYVFILISICLLWKFLSMKIGDVKNVISYKLGMGDI